LCRTKDDKTKDYTYAPGTNRLERINNKEVILDPCAVEYWAYSHFCCLLFLWRTDE
jgi:hypothetical protein